MKSAPDYLFEKERLDSLSALNILDTLPESDYDAITSLAAQICQTPISLICMVDKERIWFKSRNGISATQIPKEAAVCAYAILQKEAFIVEDMTLDDRFFDTPLVTGAAHFRFYAGVPLMSPDNFAIGTLCIIDTKARSITVDQIKSLHALSAQITRLLELKIKIAQLMTHENQLRLLEQQINESARLSTLGEMTAGIAHEINNPLTIIQCKSKILKRKCEDGTFDLKANAKDFDIINTTVDRIVKIVKGLKTYSRNSENDPFRPANLKSLIDETLSLCVEHYKFEDITVSVNCCPSLEIDCRSSQISQVLMNLISNSHDAIENLKDKWIKINVIEERSVIRVLVSDSGKGIPTEIVHKMTLPFFTTKELGKGTGLGLSISKGILESHGGYLIYDSGKANTTFALTFPKKRAA